MFTYTALMLIGAAIIGGFSVTICMERRQANPFSAW